MIACTGHNGEEPRAGILRSLIVSLVCMVLLHLTNRWIPGEAKKMSPLAICSIGENALIE